MKMIISGAILLINFSFLLAAPKPPTRMAIITGRKDFFPVRVHQQLPGKIVGVLVPDAGPMLALEGRSGPADQLCLGLNGGSYRWLYVSVPGTPQIGTLKMDLPDGKKQEFPNLSMCSKTTIKHFEIPAHATLVEVEVNGGAGAPAGDAFVVTSFKRLDGTKEFPIDIAKSLINADERIKQFQSEYEKTINEKMLDARKKALGDGVPTGPEETQNTTYITWWEKVQLLEVRRKIRITNGRYQYGNGIKIDLPPALPPPPQPQGGKAPPPRLPNGLRYGSQYGVEIGFAVVYDKQGNYIKTNLLPAQGFTAELPPPPISRPRPFPLPVPPKRR
ncbi:MAG: hypothetical protein R3B84_05055 [Zavarzinella sp.]